MTARRDGAAAPAVDRRQVLAHRIAAHGLDRRTDDPAVLRVLDLGVQETNVGSARAALLARLDDPGMALDDPRFALVWSIRGAPHLHRRVDLPELTRALWPIGDADAEARLGLERAAIRQAGIGGVEAFTLVARALRRVVTRPLGKGEVSAAVTARLPDALSFACASCAAVHVHGGIFQQAGVFAGVGLVPGTTPAVLVPLGEQPALPPPVEGPGALVRCYLGLNGPAGPAEVAAHLGTTRSALRGGWPGDLVEVRLDGRAACLPAEDLEVLLAAQMPDVVRLLPPADPFLQARDRDVLVPDRSRRKVLWRAVGSPGAVLAGGEMAAVWRARLVRRVLAVTVQPFVRLPTPTRDAVQAEAQRLARARGAEEARVSYDEA